MVLEHHPLYFIFHHYLIYQKTNYSLIHIAPVFFLGFTNFILLKKIFLNFKEKKFFYLILLSILSLAFINIFFIEWLSTVRIDQLKYSYY